MVYEFKYLTKEDRLLVLERRQKANEYDMYELQVKLQELEQASNLDTEMIDIYTNAINDKMAQISLLESMIVEL